MRLRLVVPRRGRRGSLGAVGPSGSRRPGWTSAAGALAAAGLLAVAGCGGGDHHARPKPPPTRPEPPLVLGVTEANPFLLAPTATPAPFTAWRDRLAALKPRYLRVLVVWSQVQPDPDAPPNWSAPADGCLRGAPPCASFAGIRDELRAAKAAGMQVLVTFLGTPAWAASPPSGCERPGTGPGARMPARLSAYRLLVRSLLDQARSDHVDIAWWSPWNEPNHPAFLNPQRERCSADAPTTAADLYAQLARAMKAELDAAPGEQHLLLGEVAGLETPRTTATAAAEFARDLPDDVACMPGAVWSQHAYVQVAGDLAGDATAMPPGSAPLLDAVETALDGHGCPRRLPLWITETGVTPKDGAAGCAAMATALRAWARDPRVEAAFQYTYRADPAFDVGLADPSLRRTRPAYAAWLAAAQGRPGAC